MIIFQRIFALCSLYWDNRYRLSHVLNLFVVFTNPTLCFCVCPCLQIKNLAADVCLDRAVVLKLLRDPPPNLLLMSATLPDKPISPILDPESEPQEKVSSDAAADVEQPESKVKVPVHVMQSDWSARKRLKKVQVQTLERVYARIKRPSVSDSS